MTIEHDGPGAEINPVLEMTFQMLKTELTKVGLGDTIFALVCLMPRASDRAGFDVVRCCSNVGDGEVMEFLNHVIRNEVPADNKHVKVLSLRQARALIAAIDDTDRTMAELKKKGVH